MQWSAEANALITTFFFGWLVGPLERKPIEVHLQLGGKPIQCSYVWSHISLTSVCDAWLLWVQTFLNALW